IPEPSIRYAMGIVLVAAVTNLLVGIVIWMAVAELLEPGPAARGPRGGGPDPEQLLKGPGLIAPLISLPVGFLVCAGVSALMLPASFGRACLVTLFEHLILLFVGFVVVACVIAALGIKAA